MKKHAVLFFVALLLFSCTESTKKTESVLSGSIENSPNGLISLVGTEYEKDIILEEDGSFQTELELPYDGYYNAIMGRIPLALYLEKGKDLSFDVDLQEFKESLEFSGELSDENTFLSKKQEIANIDMRQLFQVEPASFLDSISEIDTQYKTALVDANIENKNFVESQEKEFLYQKAGYINAYEELYKYLTETDQVDLPQDFYATLENIDFADEKEFKHSTSYQQLVESYYNKKASRLSEETDHNNSITYMELIDEAYPKGYAKNQLLKSVVGYNLKPDQHLDAVYKKYMSIQTDEELIQNMEESYATLKKILPGETSPTFDYENINGGTTSLDDLKGKYIYVDVWATWCMPCLQEIPYLKEVAEEYKDKNVEFVGISIDSEKDYEKWQNMVKEKELAGVQLYSGGDAWQSDFVKEYNIQGIPRFILIDPEGNIFDADTYRPSDKKLRELFDEIL